MLGAGAGLGRRTRLAAVRRSAGHTQESLAAALRMDRSTVARWEQGESNPLPRVRRRLAAALDVSPGELDRLLGDEPPRTHVERSAASHEDGTVGPGPSLLTEIGVGVDLGVSPEEFVARTGVDVAVPRRVTGTDVEIVRAVTSALASAENVLGGGVVAQAGLGQLRWSAKLLTATANPDVRRRLFEAVGNLAEVVGFIAFDVGDFAAAARCFRFALWCADEAGSWPLRSCTLADVARTYAETGDVDSALSAIEFARVRQDRLSLTARAMLAVMRARYLALTGCHDDALREVDVADDNIADRDPVIDPPWLCYYDEAEHDGSVGRALVPVAVARRTPELAASRLESAVRLQAPGYPRSKVFSRLRLATLLMRAGDPDEAAAVGGEALLEAQGLQSRRVLDELDRLRRAVERHAGPAAAGDLRRAIVRRLAEARGAPSAAEEQT